MRALVVALVALAAPVLAQPVPEAAPSEPLVASAVDPLVVGEWRLDEVTEPGYLGLMGAQVRAMRCAFGTDGTATVSMTVLQDQDQIERSKTFAFETESGQIVSEDDSPVRYRVLTDGRLELSDATGLVVLLARAGA